MEKIAKCKKCGEELELDDIYDKEQCIEYCLGYCPKCHIGYQWKCNYSFVGVSDVTEI